MLWGLFNLLGLPPQPSIDAVALWWRRASVIIGASAVGMGGPESSDKATAVAADGLHTTAPLLALRQSTARVPAGVPDDADAEGLLLAHFSPVMASGRTSPVEVVHVTAPLKLAKKPAEDATPVTTVVKFSKAAKSAAVGSTRAVTGTRGYLPSPLSGMRAPVHNGDSVGSEDRGAQPVGFVSSLRTTVAASAGLYMGASVCTWESDGTPSFEYGDGAELDDDSIHSDDSTGSPKLQPLAVPLTVGGPSVRAPVDPTLDDAHGRL
jgi:hypothetical protein